MERERITLIPMVWLRFGGTQSGVARKTSTDGSDNGSSNGGGSRSPMPSTPIPKAVRRLSSASYMWQCRNSAQFLLGQKRRFDSQSTASGPALPVIPSVRRHFSNVRSADMQRSKKGHYSITSSARARSAGGISSPSAFAALRLITNSSLFGNSTGRSDGLAPLRILTT